MLLLFQLMSLIHNKLVHFIFSKFFKYLFLINFMHFYIILICLNLLMYFLFVFQYNIIMTNNKFF